MNQKKALVSQELIRAKAESSRDEDSEEEMKNLSEKVKLAANATHLRKKILENLIVIDLRVYQS